MGPVMTGFARHTQKTVRLEQKIHVDLHRLQVSGTSDG